MVDYVTLNRGSLLRQMIAQYEDELEIERARLDSLSLKRTVLRFCTEDLVEHGRASEARELLPRIQVLDEHIKAKLDLIARMERVLSDCDRKLKARVAAA